MIHHFKMHKGLRIVSNIPILQLVCRVQQQFLAAGAIPNHIRQAQRLLVVPVLSYISFSHIPCNLHRIGNVIRTENITVTQNVLVVSAKFCCQHRTTCPPYISTLHHFTHVKVLSCTSYFVTCSNQSLCNYYEVVHCQT